MWVETEYMQHKMDDEDFTYDFAGWDVWTDRRPDIIENGANVLELPLDRVQDFNIMPVKCYKQCDDNGECKFNAHFWRFFETNDGKDYQLDENFDETFHMLGFFEVYDLEYGLERRLGAGMSDDIKLKMGRVRDYELSGANYLASMTIAGVTLLSLMMLN